MNQKILRYGLLGGGIMILLVLLSYLLFKDSDDFSSTQLVGYLTMILSMTTVPLGIKAVKAQQPEGTLTFWKAFKVGFFISLVIAFFYALIWVIMIHTLLLDFPEKYTEWTVKGMQEAGKSAAEIAEAKKSMAQGMEMLRNPILGFLISLMEIIPVGAIIAALSALFLKSKQQG